MRAWLNQNREKLLVIRDTPESIAWGAAIGMFLGFTPVFGVKTLLALVLASLFRVNRIAAFVGVTLHDVALPFWPVVYRLEYDMGYWLLHHPHQLPPNLDLQQFHPSVWLKWAAFSTVLGPTLLGAVLIGAPMSWLTWLLTRKATRRQAERQPWRIEDTVRSAAMSLADQGPTKSAPNNDPGETDSNRDSAR